MRSGFTLIEVMVTLGVLAAVLVVTNQVVVSAIRQVEVSKNAFYVDVVLSEAFEHMNYVHDANLLRYGSENFEQCKLTRLDEDLDVNCENLRKYGGQYVLAITGGANSQLWNLETLSGDIVDDLDNPTTFVSGYEAFEVYEYCLDYDTTEGECVGGVVYTNVTGDVSADPAYVPLGYYRYIDIDGSGSFRLVVAYEDEFSNISVEKPDYVINADV